MCWRFIRVFCGMGYGNENNGNDGTNLPHFLDLDRLDCLDLESTNFSLWAVLSINGSVVCLAQLLLFSVPT